MLSECLEIFMGSLTLSWVLGHFHGFFDIFMGSFYIFMGSLTFSWVL